MKWNLLVLGMIACLPLAAQNNYDTVKIHPQKLTSSIYMLQGAGGNMGLLLGDDGALLIDDEFAPLSGKIKDAVYSLNGGDVKVLVNTHVHGDHTGGNENFGKWGVMIVAQDQVRERMMAAPRDKSGWPVVTFPDRINLHWDNEDLELYHVGPGHTDGDVIIRFRKANVIHTGDLFVRYGYPFIDVNTGGSVNGFINNLDKILELSDDNTKIIPGHGDMSTRKDVQQFRDRIVEMRDAVQAALKKGTKVSDVSGLPIASKYDAEWGQSFIKGKEFVLMMAENLTKEKSK